MTVVLELKPETEEALQKKAKAKGFEVNVYVENLIEKDIHEGKTIDEILAPVRQEFDESGMSEDELDRVSERCCVKRFGRINRQIIEDKYARKAQNRFRLQYLSGKCSYLKKVSVQNAKFYWMKGK